VGVASLRFLGRPGQRIFSHAVIRNEGALGAEFLEADIRLLGEDGCVVGELLGFRAKLVSGDAEREARENPDELLYGVSWVEKRSTPPKSENNSQPTSWYIIADRGGLGQSLAAQLRSQGKHCSVTSPENAKDLLPVLGNVNVIHLASLDICSPDSRSDALLDAQKQWIQTFEFIQSLLKKSHEAKQRLWIVTRGAQSVGTQPAPVSVAQTPLWGLAKSVDLEHPELACTRIDLDPEAGAEELAALREELSLPAVEREVAYRKGTRYVARLVQRAHKASNGSLMEIPETD
jgi:hypothetical protein